MRIKLQKVRYMPKVLESGILYVSEEFETAAHLCACGCGAKIRTPLGPTEWGVTETSAGPSLWPSVGSWQQQCKSHYVIKRGEIEWAGQWSTAQIERGREREERKREAHYKTLQNANPRKRGGFIGWLKKLFGA